MQPQDQAGSGMHREIRLASASVSRETRVMPPGSEWLYFKLYGGAGILDDILTTAVLPLTRAACASGDAIRWFFIRYADPQEHLRVRFHGSPDRLHQQVMPLAFQMFNPLSGKLWKIELDTYQREIERYGGPEGMLLAEDIFFADSEAVLEILRELGGDEGLDIRWRIGLVSIDRLLSDFNFDLIAKREIMERLSEVLRREFKVNAALKQQLSEKFRSQRHELEEMVRFSAESSLPWSFARQALDKRSARMAEAVSTLRTLRSQGKLAADLPELALSFVHMHINRLIRAAQRAHELVLYDFLQQLYDSQIARRACR